MRKKRFNWISDKGHKLLDAIDQSMEDIVAVESDNQTEETES